MLNIPLKDQFRETRLFSSRLILLGVFITLGSLILLSRMVYLQVIHHRHYEDRARANQITPVPIRPVRGRIHDRNGIILAQNYRIYTLEIVPEQVDDMASTLKTLSTLISLNDEDIRRFEQQRKERPAFEAITLRTHLSEQEAAVVAINRPYLPGVELDARLQRHYPLGNLGAHMIGYVGAISVKDLKRIDQSAYRGMKQIGKTGVERQYEPLLMGRIGVRKLETSVRGRTGREVGERIAPRAGKHIYLNIDARMQALAEKALQGRRGAVVAMDPLSGAILVLASVPGFDLNPFINGVDQSTYQALVDDPDEPLFNRAINGRYAPGSTIKPVFGLAALESGKVNAHSIVQCNGYYSLPGDSHRYRDWTALGHGPTNLHHAIKRSCDVYFYKNAVTLGIDYLATYLDRFGFGRATGVDLPGESEGLIPSAKWREKRRSKWYLGETVVTGIGQGPVLVTPVQLAMITSALANGKHLITPRLLHMHEDPVTHERMKTRPVAGDPLPITNSEYLGAVIAGMEAVVHDKLGTAYRIGWDAPYRIAGKTGTAQVKSIAQGETYNAKKIDERHRDHALFIAFAPADRPRIAVAVIVENGGHGSSAAAPIARLIMDAYLLPGKLPPLTTAAKRR